MPKEKICFVINHVAFFVSHRLSIARNAMENGYSVYLLTGQAGSESMEGIAEEILLREQIAHRRVGFRSSSINPFLEGWALLKLIYYIRKIKPKIVHCASPKGVLYGGIAARIAGVPCLVLSVSGMGYAFTDNDNNEMHRNMIASMYTILAKFVFKHKNICVIVQNRDDFKFLISSGWLREDAISLIPGSGVDLALYPPVQYSEKQNIVLFPARVLIDKGIFEFVDAAKIVRKAHPTWKFVIAGSADYDNPSAVNEKKILSWVSENWVEWVGHVNSMPELFLKSKIVCLPSYREGMPKALLEAAAAACAIVTTNVPGCREAIEIGVTGDIVPVRDSRSLASALIELIADQERCERYSYNGRRRAVEKYSIETVLESTFSIYKELEDNVSERS